MAVYIDPPTWPGHGRWWSHLVSDVSFAELHAFAAQLGAPPRAFERDHYDIPASRYDDAVRLGAIQVGSKEIVARLHAAGLRRRKHAVPRTGPSGTGDQDRPGTSAQDSRSSSSVVRLRRATDSHWS